MASVRWLHSLSWNERIVLGLVASSLAVAALHRPVVRAVDPALAHAHYTRTWRDLQGDLMGGSLWLIWVVIAVRCIRSRRSRRHSIEALRIVWIAIGPLIASVWLLAWVGVPDGVLELLQQSALVPLPVAVIGSTALPWLLAAAWLRLRKQAPDPS